MRSVDASQHVLFADDDRRLRIEARDLARSLTGARDAQSALDALNDLAKHGLALSPRSLAGARIGPAKNSHKRPVILKSGSVGIGSTSVRPTRSYPE